MIYFLPFIAAVTGWLTNWIAVKMLFHPVKPLNLGLFKIQGIFPKRQKAMAEKLGQIVATELFSIDDIVSKMKTADNTEVLKFVESKLDDFINLKLSTSMPMLAMFLNDDLKNKIKTALLNEIGEVIPGIIETYANKLKEDVNIEHIVYDKVINFSSDKMEEVLYSIMKKEFKFIEVLGGILGFFIGVIQLLLVIYS
jgi:uncharacterized membrane protein YheB (UPF0754 family)